MIVAIDAGNTRIKWGLHDGEAWVGNGALPTSDVAQLLDVACQWSPDAEVVACNVAGPTVGEIVEKMATRSRRRLTGNYRRGCRRCCGCPCPRCSTKTN